MSADCRGRLANRGADHGGAASSCNGGLGFENLLMLFLELLTLGLKERLELGLRGSLVGLGLLEFLEFTFPGGGGVQTFLGEYGGFGGEGLIDPDLDGVLGFGVTGGHSCRGETTLLDGAGEVGGRARKGALSSDEGGGGTVTIKELVLEVVSA